MTNEEIKLLKNFITWQSLPFVDNLFTHEDEIIKKFDEWLRLNDIEQQPKTGHWIRVTDEAGHLVWECDKCGWQQKFNTNFCSDCGANMSEVIKELSPITSKAKSEEI